MRYSLLMFILAVFFKPSCSFRSPEMAAGFPGKNLKIKDQGHVIVKVKIMKTSENFNFIR